MLLVVGAGQLRERWLHVNPTAARSPTSNAAITTTTGSTAPVLGPSATRAPTTTTLPEPHGDLEPGVRWDEAAGALREYLNAILDRRYADAYGWLCSETQAKVSEADLEARLEAVPAELRTKAYRIEISNYSPGSEYAGSATILLIYGPARHSSELGFIFRLVGVDHRQPYSWRICAVETGQSEVIARVWPCSAGLGCHPPVTPTS